MRKLCFIEFRCQTSQGAGPGRQSWAPKKSAFLHRVPVTRHFDRRARRCKAGRKNDTGADAPKRAKKTCSKSLCFNAMHARVIRDLLAATRPPVICFYPYAGCADCATIAHGLYRLYNHCTRAVETVQLLHTGCTYSTTNVHGLYIFYN